MEINIFMHCHFSWYVWYKIFIWFGLWIAMLGDLVSLIQNVRKGWRWCDTWLCSRGIGRENLEEWILKRRDGISCLFYEWLVDPPDCILE
jgi:hypothetical protein